MNKSTKATLKKEMILWEKDMIVIGVDEVGRGALSGPMFVGAACFTLTSNINEIKLIKSLNIQDSKLLSKKKREDLFFKLKKILLGYTTVSIPVAYINKYGIQAATRKAFQTVIDKLIGKIGRNKYYILLDGREVVKIKHKYCLGQKAIIDGDALSVSIASASIIAKVKRDRYMEQLAKKYPQYKWDKNKGYGTKEHINALKKYGKTEYHRDLYIRNFIS